MGWSASGASEPGGRRRRSGATTIARLFMTVASLAVILALASTRPASTVGSDTRDRMGVTTPQTIAAGGSDFLCGIRTDLRLSCWGRPTVALGAPPDGRFAALSAGRRAVCALAVDATMSCWGRWYSGGAPVGVTASAPSGRFLTLDVADTQACAVRTNQSITCWGRWLDGASPLPSGPPTGRFVAVAAVHDWYGGCAIRVDGSLACWGPDTWGEATPPSGTFQAIESGRQMYCAIRTEGTIACWGRQLYGMDHPPEGRYTALAIGGDTGCAIALDRSVACWGAAIPGMASPPPTDRSGRHSRRDDRRRGRHGWDGTPVGGDGILADLGIRAGAARLVRDPPGHPRSSGRLSCVRRRCPSHSRP